MLIPPADGAPSGTAGNKAPAPPDRNKAGPTAPPDRDKAGPGTPAGAFPDHDRAFPGLGAPP